MELARLLLTRDGEKDLRAATAVDFAITASGGNWVPYPHLLYLHERLLDVACDRVRNLLISMPPQHGKSELASIYFLAWMLGNFPDWRIAVVCYNSELAEGIGDRVLELIDRWGMELWGIKISPRKRSAKRFNLVGHTGGLIAVGLGGTLTGKRVDMVILDDRSRAARRP